MTQIAMVSSIKPGNMAEISLRRESACGKSCAQGAGCFASKRFIAVDALNEVNASVGDTVVVESSSERIIKIAALVYLTPLVTFFLSYFCLSVFESEVRLALSGACFFLGFLAPFLYSRRLGGRREYGFFRITKVLGR